MIIAFCDASEETAVNLVLGKVSISAHDSYEGVMSMFLIG